MTDVDEETLAEYATQMLERPGDAAFWDERLYTTHGAGIAWAERGDDILAESNYRTVLAHLQGVAEDEEDVIDGTFRHWAVGSLRQIFVRVYREGYNWEVEGLAEREGKTPPYTAAFIAMVEVGETLKDYPVWDESDYSELENEYWYKSYTEELDWLINHPQGGYESLLEEVDNDPDLRLWLERTVSEAYYGYSEPGWVDPTWILESIEDAKKAMLADLAEDAGQTTLEIKED